MSEDDTTTTTTTTAHPVDMDALREDADRLLDAAFEDVKRQALSDPAYKVKAPPLFCPVHADSAERPIIGGTAKYKELWAQLQEQQEQQE